MNMRFHTKSLFLLDFEHKFVPICVEVYPQGHVLIQGQATLLSLPSTFDQNRLHLPATMQTLIGCTRLDGRHSWAAVMGFQSQPTPRLVGKLSGQLSEKCFWTHFRRERSHAVAGSFHILSWQCLIFPEASCRTSTRRHWLALSSQKSTLCKSGVGSATPHFLKRINAYTLSGRREMMVCGNLPLVSQDDPSTWQVWHIKILIKHHD